eukprot:6208204-Pleurochrysis_carterae.AAC.5
MAALRAPASLARASLHAKGGASALVYVALAVLYSIVGRQMYATMGDPYAAANAQLLRIDATGSLVSGIETRSALALQEGLTKAADIADFNSTLFDEVLHSPLSLEIGSGSTMDTASCPLKHVASVENRQHLLAQLLPAF